MTEEQARFLGSAVLSRHQVDKGGSVSSSRPSPTKIQSTLWYFLGMGTSIWDSDRCSLFLEETQLQGTEHLSRSGHSCPTGLAEPSVKALELWVNLYSARAGPIEKIISAAIGPLYPAAHNYCDSGPWKARMPQLGKLTQLTPSPRGSEREQWGTRDTWEIRNPTCAKGRSSS